MKYLLTSTGDGQVGHLLSRVGADAGGFYPDHVFELYPVTSQATGEGLPMVTIEPDYCQYDQPQPSAIRFDQFVPVVRYKQVLFSMEPGQAVGIVVHDQLGGHWQYVLYATDDGMEVEEWLMVHGSYGPWLRFDLNNDQHWIKCLADQARTDGLRWSPLPAS